MVRAYVLNKSLELYLKASNIWKQVALLEKFLKQNLFHYKESYYQIIWGLKISQKIEFFAELIAAALSKVLQNEYKNVRVFIGNVSLAFYLIHSS